MTDFETVKQSVDIVRYIESRGLALKKQGRLYVACCPFHIEKTPSFKVDPESQRWQCFGACGTGGDVFTFVENYDHVDTGEALRIVASYAGINLEKTDDPHKRLYDLLEDTARLYQQWLFSDVGEHALKYLIEKRGLTPEIIRQFRIGYTGSIGGNTLCSGNLIHLGYTDEEQIEAGVARRNDAGKMYDFFRSRIMIPMMDKRGRVVGFTGRILNPQDTPKYINSGQSKIFNKGQLIFGGTLGAKNRHGASDTLSKVLVLVEGHFDVIQAHSKGFTNVCAQMGTSLSDDQMDLICRGDVTRVVFCLDRDNAGRKALKELTQKHVGRLASKGIELYAMFSPHGKDPDDCLRERSELWQPAVDAAQPVVSVLIDLEIATLGKQPSAADKTKLANDLLPILKNDNPFVEDENIRMLAGKIGIAFDRLKDWARPQIRMLDKPAPIKHDPSPLPTTEEWVLHGIVVNEADFWLTRANSCLLIASDDPMPYALSPLSDKDFIDPTLKRLFAICLKSQSAQEMIGGAIDTSLEKTYERIKTLDAIGKEFGLHFDYKIFIDRVYQLRLDRLRKERPSFEAKEPAKARECAMGIACLQLAQEEMI